MAGEPPRDQDDDARFAPPRAPDAPPAALELAEAPLPKRSPPPRIVPSDRANVPAISDPPAATRLALSATAVLLAPFAALLPATWRARWRLDGLPLRFGALLQGLAQVAAAMIVFFLMVKSVNDRLVAPHLDSVLHAMAENEDALHFGPQATGATTWIYVACSWGGVACVYALVEALARLAAAGATGEVLPSGPLVLLDVAGRAALRWRHERRLPPRSIDEVQRSHDTLTIATCRVRDWPPGTVLIVDDLAWCMRRLETCAGTPRPFVYCFAPAPEGQVVRGRRVYRPDELVRP
jgi:hypothetical protein